MYLDFGGVGKDDSIALQGYWYSLTIAQVTSQVQAGMNQKQLHQQTCVGGMKWGKGVRGEQTPHWVKPGDQPGPKSEGVALAFCSSLTPATCSCCPLSATFVTSAATGLIIHAKTISK